MITAYRLYTGTDGHSHVERGTVVEHQTIATKTIHFEESPPHSSLDWHTAPTTQYVIMLAGVLEFEMHGGQTFTIKPGEVLIALDTTGSGHKWRLVNDEPWKRAYVLFYEHTQINFKLDEEISA